MSTVNYPKRSPKCCIHQRRSLSRHHCSLFHDPRVLIQCTSMLVLDKLGRTPPEVTWCIWETPWLLVRIANGPRTRVWYYSPRMAGSCISRAFSSTIHWRHPLHYTDGPWYSKRDTRSCRCYRQTLWEAPSVIWHDFWRLSSLINQVISCWGAILTIHLRGGPRASRQSTTAYVGCLLTKNVRGGRYQNHWSNRLLQL